MSLSISTRSAFRSGMRDGVPIGLGYFAVSFSLGIEVPAEESEQGS